MPPTANARGGRRAGWLLPLLAFLPALATGLLVLAHAENVPAWDDFERVPLLQRFVDGQLGFDDLYAPHIDHRIVVPRLIILANAVLSGGNLVWENAVACLIVLGTALALAGLLRRTLPGAPVACFAALLGFNLLIFSPLQWENFLWAIQTAFVLPMACLAAALLVLETRLPVWARFGLALAAAVVGTHSFSHGLAIWVAVPAWVLLRVPFAEGSREDRRRFLFAWAAAAAVFLIPYFSVDYRAASSQQAHQYGVGVGDSTPLVAYAGESLASPLVVAHFYVSMVGSPLARLGSWAPAQAALVWGLVVHGLLAAALAAIAMARDRELWRRSIPWWILAGVALMSCALAALGRAVATKGIYALAPRYVSVSQYVLVALVALGALLALRGARARAVVTVVALVLIAPVAGGWHAGIQGMRAWQTARLQARTSLLFIQDFSPRFIRRLDYQWETARAYAESLDRYAYLDPPLARSLRPDAFEVVSLEEDGVSGRIRAAHAVGDRLLVRGEAALAHGRPAHGVLLTVGDGSERRVVGIGEGRSRPEGRVYLHDHLFGEVELDPDEPTGLWRAKVDLARLPDAPVVHVQAFLVDSGRMRIYPLAQSVSISRGAGRAQVELVPAAGQAP